MASDDKDSQRGNRDSASASSRLRQLKSTIERSVDSAEAVASAPERQNREPRTIGDAAERLGRSPRAAAPRPEPARASLVRSMMADIQRKERAPERPPRNSAAEPGSPGRRRRGRESVGLSGGAAAGPAVPRPTPAAAAKPRQPKAVRRTDEEAIPAPTANERVVRAKRIAEKVRSASQRRGQPRPLAEKLPPPDATLTQTDPAFSTAASAALERAAVSDAEDVAAPSRKLRVARTRPFAGFEWNIASRYLRARRKEGFISVIAGFSLVGIALGVATLIIVMAVMTGFRETLIDQILGVNAHVNVVSQTEEFRDFDPLADAIRQVEGVERVWPSIEGQVLASSASGHTGVLVRGVRQDDLRQLRVVRNPEASRGSIDGFTGDRGVALGDGVARKLGLRVGDSITLITPDGDLTPFGVTPRRKSYPVTYIFKLGLSQYDGYLVYMPLTEAQLYFNKKGQIDSLDVTIADPNLVDDMKQPIRAAADRSVGLFTWRDQQGSLIGALDVERNVMFLILTLIILVAALNIISGLVMLVKDKSRDIAIMRTMGMSRGAVLRIFFICGSSIGVVGAVIGAILGVLFCLNISAIQKAVERVTGPVFPAEVYGLSGLPARLEASDVLLTLAIALGLSFLATLYPAWKAAKLDPVEALRYE